MPAEPFKNEFAPRLRFPLPRMFVPCVGLLLCSFSAAAADLTVQVRNVKPKTGTVIVALFDKAAGFPEPGTPAAVQVIDEPGNAVTAVFRGLSADRYAVAVFQDENKNGKLDKNFLGAPIEPYGFSNDARGSMAPPSFDAAAINPAATPNIIVNLQ